MTTPPNPQQLLRRPKKPAAKGANSGMLAVGIIGGLLIGVGVGGFVVFGHGKSAASTPAQSTSAQVASVPVAQSYAPNFGSTVKHASHKPGEVVKPLPGASPTPAPTTTPNATPTPPDSTHPANATEIAKAKHQAAVHLANLRRAQAAAQANTNSGQPASTLGTATNAAGSQVNTQTLPVATQAPTPVPAAATPDAQPTPVYAPRVVVDARFIDRVSPAYPDIAREQGAQGTAIVLAAVGPRGNVISVQIDQSTGNKLLDQAALFAARTSRFQPPEIDGKPATETYRIVYTFDLNS